MLKDSAHTRRTYQDDGCRCADCRAANTAYTRQYRQAYRSGRPPLGAHVSGTEAHGLIRQLLLERFSRADLAQRLGQAYPWLQYDQGVTLRTVLKLRWLVRQVTA